MISAAERLRRTRGLLSGRLHSLPILALVVHSACNCRCVMCDIWRANARQQEISDETLATHVAAIRRLHVQRVMLTGGEPLLHRNLWALCDRLRAEGIALTLVTTGLLAGRDAEAIAAVIDTVVVSVDGPPEVHDAVRGVPRGFAKIRDGVRALAATATPPRLIARSVVQRGNYHAIAETIAATREAGFDELSFLAADLTSTAFNRAAPWSPERQAEVAVPAEALPDLAAAIARADAQRATEMTNGFVVGGRASLQRVHDYYAAAAGQAPFPEVRCNAPWVSAVLQPDGYLRPCFFLPPYERANEPLDEALNGAAAIAFRQYLDVARNPTCQRCVCSLRLPIGATV